MSESYLSEHLILIFIPTKPPELSLESTISQGETLSIFSILRQATGGEDVFRGRSHCLLYDVGHFPPALEMDHTNVATLN